MSLAQRLRAAAGAPRLADHVIVSRDGKVGWRRYRERLESDTYPSVVCAYSCHKHPFAPPIAANSLAC